MSAVELVMAALAGANLLGIGGLYYRLGGAMARLENVQQDIDALAEDTRRLSGRVTALERQRPLHIIREN